MMTMMTDEQITERAEILAEVDAQVCQRCGRSALDCDAASDPRWFIDSELEPHADHPEWEPTRLAVIFCPACW